MFLIFLVLLTILIFYLFFPKKNGISKYIPFPKNERVYLKEKDLEEILTFNINEKAQPFYFIFNVQTTGLIKGKDPHPLYDSEKYPDIVQIGYLLFSKDFELVTSNNIYFKQIKAIPKKATEIHGITKEFTIINGLDPTTGLKKVVSDMSKCKILVSHNNSFNYDVLFANLVKFNCNDGPELKVSLYCTMKDTEKYCTNYFKSENLSLQQLFHCCFFDSFKYLNGFFVKNDALIKAKITSACFLKIKKIEKEKNFEISRFN